MSDPTKPVMTPETLAALRKSIKKWDCNTRAKTLDDAKVDAADCPLCTLFWVRNLGCASCPVREKTGLDYCVGTPYEDALDAYEDWQQDISTRDAFHATAADERDFLISLLPPGELP